jgi:hypothetical protein
MLPVNSGFRRRVNFTENQVQFGHAPSRRFVNPALGRKFLKKNIGLKGRHIINLPGTPTYLVQALLLQCKIDMEYFQKLVTKHHYFF